MIKMMVRLLIALFFVGCSASNSDFSGILDNSSGGTGNASISITSFSPGATSLAIKDINTKTFLVAAVGTGTLRYRWSLDDQPVGIDIPSYTFNAAATTIGVHSLRVDINDELGSVNQTWTIKVNGPPVVQSATPLASSVYTRRASAQSYAVTVTDPNADTLTYKWKLDGQEDVLTSTIGSTDWTPGMIDVGPHNVTVDIYDGPVSDEGTYVVSRSWTTYVNHFSNSCNFMENNSSTNLSCVFSGIAGIGDGLNPLNNPSQTFLRPAAFAKTAEDNLFIGDDSNHVVWFYNLHTAPSVTVLGVQVPINTMKVVAGTGQGSSGNSSSSKALRNFLNNPHGLAWDGTNLYISDASNNRVIKVDSNGDLSNILTSGCSSPRGLAITGGSIYVACYSSHIIRAVDLTTLVASTFAGTGAAGNPAALTESTFTDPTNGVLRGPYAIDVDASGNLYVGEHTGCRVRFYNRTGGPITFYGSYTVNASRQRIILGPAGAPSCSLVTGEPVGITPATDARIGNVRSVRWRADGLIVLATDSDAISVINTNAGASSFFGVPINGYEAAKLIGSGTAGYLGEGQVPNVTRFNNPYDIIEDSTNGDNYIADNGNLRLRKITTAENKTELIAGNGSTRVSTNAGQGTLEVGLEKMTNIRGLAYDEVTGEVFVADMSNNRIRVISRYGVVSQAVGTGTSGSGAEENDFPSNVTMNQPRGLVLTHKTATFGGHLVWADASNHRIRLWNRGPSTQILFGVSVDSGKVVTIGGDGTSGTATSGSAQQSAFNTPSGVAFDGTDLYVADTNNHCVKKIDSAGDLSVVAGTCGSSGNVNGPVGIGKMSSPEGIDYYENGTHRGIVIAARGNTRIKFFRMAGTSLLFGGSISVGDTNSVACGGTFHTEDINANLSPCSGVYDVATVGTRVCFTNYTYHNARCINATGEVSTIMGGPQGIDDTTPLFAPGGTFDGFDFDVLNPNYASQNGVTSAYLPVPLAEPLLTEAYGQLNYPMAIRPINSTTVLIGEYSLGLIRKVKLP
jgi:hypothetical protein